MVTTTKKITDMYACTAVFVCRNLVIYILSYMLEHDLQRTSQYIEPEFAVMSIWDSQREKGPRAYYKK